MSKLDGSFVGKVKKHEWTSPTLKELIKWERNLVEPKPEFVSHHEIHSGQHNTHSTCTDIISESGL